MDIGVPSSDGAVIVIILASVDAKKVVYKKPGKSSPHVATEQMQSHDHTNKLEPVLPRFY